MGTFVCPHCEATLHSQNRDKNCPICGKPLNVAVANLGPQMYQSLTTPTVTITLGTGHLIGAGVVVVVLIVLAIMITHAPQQSPSITVNRAVSTNPFVGTWQAGSDVMYLYENHTGTAGGGVWSGKSLKWTQDGNKINFFDWSDPWCGQYGEISEDGKFMRTDGEHGYMNLTKVE